MFFLSRSAGIAAHTKSILYRNIITYNYSKIYSFLTGTFNFLFFPLYAEFFLKFVQNLPPPSEKMIDILSICHYILA